jgi:hypothetical protein
MATFKTGNSVINQLAAGTKLHVTGPGEVGFNTGNSTVAGLEAGTELTVVGPGLVSYATAPAPTLADVHDTFADGPDQTISAEDLEDLLREALRNIFSNI